MELLKELTQAFGAPGCEGEVADIVRREFQRCNVEVSIDTLGNVIGFKHCSGKKNEIKRIMIAAHIDEIGFIVRHIDEKGFLRLATIGGFDPFTLISQRVIILGKGKKKLLGLLNLSSKPVHLQTKEERKRDLEVSDFFVDLGMKATQVINEVEIGDKVIWDREFHENGDCVTCKALDNRVGVYIMIEVLKRLKSPKHDIYFVGTVQEEIGLRGATTSSYDINPDISIGIDGTLALDFPGMKDEDKITELGKGVAIKVMDGMIISDPKLVSEFRVIAEKNDIPHQLEILSKGGTDAAAMQRARSGTRAITLSVPMRYVHTVNEMANKADISGAIDLLTKYLSG